MPANRTLCGARKPYAVPVRLQKADSLRSPHLKRDPNAGNSDATPLIGRVLYTCARSAESTIMVHFSKSRACAPAALGVSVLFLLLSQYCARRQRFMTWHFPLQHIRPSNPWRQTGHAANKCRRLTNGVSHQSVGFTALAQSLSAGQKSQRFSRPQRGRSIQTMQMKVWRGVGVNNRGKCSIPWKHCGS